MSALIVSANGVPVGTLEVRKGQWKFVYATEWTDYSLSPNFPISTKKYEDTANDKPVEWFFENLLPEGRLRDLIATRDRIDSRDTWALLVRHGQDTAGALPQNGHGARLFMVSPLV
ncbi:MAG: HipA N-terminal domain-containing protein [Gallionella sp.]|nr:HipA N-terminal domain-containing protein [Gallionella sp.]